MDCVGKLEQEVGALREDIQQLHKTVNGMQIRMNAHALRELVDCARTKINVGKELNAADKATWNERIDRGELDQPDLTRQELTLTKYGPRTLQGAGKNDARLVSPGDVAYAALTRGANHLALFLFVFGVSAEEFVYDDFDQEELK